MNAYKKIIYDNYISNHNKSLYGETNISKIKAYFPVLNHYYGRHIPADKNARILDLGCGDGNSVYWLQQLGYKNTCGIDFSAEQIAKGKSMGIENLQNGDLLKYLSDNKTEFDVIMAKDVLEHFTKDEVFDLIVGTPGTQVSLSILRNSEYSAITCTRMDINELLDPRIRRDYMMHM